MNKVLTTLAITGLSIASFAQGTVQWQNVGGNFIGATNATQFSTFVASSGSPTGPGTGTTGVTLGSTTTLFYYELLTSTSSSTAPTTLSALTGSWVDTTLEAQNASGNNGRILPVRIRSPTLLPLVGPAGAVQNILLVGWSANLGTTYAAALNSLNNWSTVQSGITGNAFFGVSSLGDMASGNANPGVLVFGTTAGQINNSTTGTAAQLFLLGTSAVPEPGTMALAAVGGLSLLAFRRKK